MSNKFNELKKVPNPTMKVIQGRQHINVAKLYEIAPDVFGVVVDFSTKRFDFMDSSDDNSINISFCNTEDTLNIDATADKDSEIIISNLQPGFSYKADGIARYSFSIIIYRKYTGEEHVIDGFTDQGII